MINKVRIEGKNLLATTQKSQLKKKRPKTRKIL
jgi:hypothetical protein